MNLGHCVRHWSVSRELVLFLFQVHIEVAHKIGDFPYNGVSHKRAPPICFSEPFPCYFSENDQLRTINMSKRRITGWQIQLPYRRDIFHTGVFERRLGTSKSSRVTPKSWDLSCYALVPGIMMCEREEQEMGGGTKNEWICKVIMSYQPEKGNDDWSVLMLQRETALERGGAQ